MNIIGANIYNRRSFKLKHKRINNPVDMTATVFQKEGLKSARLRRPQCPPDQSEAAYEFLAAGFKGSTFLVCPVGGEVLTDEAAHS